MAKTSIDGFTLKRLIRAGVARVTQNVALINQLNVFPVPDGDTGVNMHHTLQRAYQEIATLETADVSVIADRFAYGALMGARGNSGTILSQLLKGFAEGLDRSERLTTMLLLPALECAVKAAYEGVSQPVEGTILTVAREAAESVKRAEQKGLPLEEKLELLVAGAQRSLDNTPNLLEVLREAGPGRCWRYGFALLLARCPAELLYECQHVGDGTRDNQRARNRCPSSALAEYGYDVQFLMRGERQDVISIRQKMEQLGESVLVVGDESAIKVHLHVENPAVPIDYAVKTGAVLDDIVIENMQLQAEAFTKRRHARVDIASAVSAMAVAVIAVAQGDGIRAVFKDLNCSVVIEGGAGASPAAEDFLSVIQDFPAERFIILPNDRNIIMAARQGARFVPGKRVQTLPTHTVLQGISAMIAFGDARDEQADPDTFVERMQEAIASVRSIEITRATRTTTINGLAIEKDEFIAILDGEIVGSAGEVKSALLPALNQVTGAETELATVYYGAEVTHLAAKDLITHLRNEVNAIDFELVYGGQDLYPYLISVE